MTVSSRVSTTTPWYQRLRLAEILPPLALLVLLLWAVTRSIGLANWARGLTILPWVALPGVLLGAALASSRRVPGWLAHLVSAGLALIWTVWQIGPLLVAEVNQEISPAYAARLDSWREYASELAVRFVAWARVLQAGGRGEDIALFVLSLALLAWALGYASSWILFRHRRAWPVVLLNGAMILINYTYAQPKQTTLFFIFLASGLLLVVLQQVQQHRRAWAGAQLDVPEYIGARFVAAAAFACGLAVLGTSLLPSNISSTQVIRAWQLMSAPLVIVREAWDNAFSTIQAPPGTSGAGFTTRTVRVGGARTLANEVVFKARSPEPDYWRAVTFDRYTGTGWESTIGERARAQLGALTAEDARTPIQTGQRMAQSDIAGRKLITQTFELVQQRNDRLVMVSGQLAAAGLPILVQNGFLTNADGALQPNYTETGSVTAERTLAAGTVYTATTYFSVADEESLRAAGNSYPQWVRDSYLQLPPSVTDRTRALAREVAARASAQTPYDQAVAIQNELRKLPYDERRPAPLDGSDWVDQFLFQTRRGYCDDFAASFVVMARSLGVPARWAQGYASGPYEPESGAYVVRQSLAHSWPEVYFPGYGWQRFEPTPASFVDVPTRPAFGDATARAASGAGLGASSRDELEELRRLRELNQVPAAADPAVQAALAERLAAARRTEQITNTLLAIAAILALAGVVLGGRWFWNRELTGLPPAALAYARLGRLGRLTGLGQRAEQTPQEYAALLGQAMPGSRRTFESIARAYAAERYGAQASTLVQLEQEWRVARAALIRRVRERLTIRRLRRE